jgi:hypothetical protein
MTLWFAQTVLPKRRLQPGELPRSAVVRPDGDYVTAALDQLPVHRGAERAGAPSHREGDRQRFRALRPSTGRQQRLDAASESPATGEPTARNDDDLAAALQAVAEAPSMHALTDIVIRSGFA